MSDAPPPDALKLVKSYYRALNCRDVETVLSLFAEDAVYLPFNVSMVEGGSYEGHAGIRQFFHEAADTWEYLHAEPETYKAVGDQILVTGYLKVRGKQSGIDVDSPAAWVWDIRDGKARRMHVYLDPDEAREAVGISDQGAAEE